jgi:tetratricopeptide (TPR) repeat protein
LIVGDPDGAEALATASLQLGNETGQPDAFALYGALLFYIRWHQGRASEILDLLAQLADENASIPAYRTAWVHALCEADRDEARALLEAERARGFETPYDSTYTTHLAGWADVATHFGDQTAAAMLYERLAPWPHVVICTGCSLNGAGAHFLGELATVLGRYDAAEAHLAEALRIHEALGAPFFIARTHLEWGRTLAARRGAGDLVRARDLVEKAQQIASTRGYLVVERRAAALLASL